MPELTEQEKLERRREKRKQKILASAENRLNRITGTAFPNRPSPTPSPSTSTSSLARSETPQRRSRSPSPFMGPSTSSETLRHRMPASSRSVDPSADPSEALGAPSPLPPQPSLGFASTDTPLPPSLEAMFANATGAGGDGNTPPPNLNDLLGGAGGPFPFNPAFLANMQQQQQQQQQELQPDDGSAKYWTLIHFVSMVWLGLYAVYREWSAEGVQRFASLVMDDQARYAAVQLPLFWYFITIELLLQTARMMYQKGNTSSTSMVMSAIMQYLPPQVANGLNVLMRYWIIFSCLIKDCLVLVFIIGLAEIVSAVLAR
ncbi:hypothetical protein O0I10_003467 [Lichtheimia ornata]|uniref:Golgi to ER traffic protein 2 n=1 Tax=Lichtheimia ornata TaxID=688661 RepID=A0AAD7V880_9FUNG|nr:uncharacterized protein O0I10_003467 [Lichtheimia ornata]KAJ8660824.1 hypothetical protein O0I10_003467 [Lichtheimia ornata]